MKSRSPVASWADTVCGWRRDPAAREAHIAALAAAAHAAFAWETSPVSSDTQNRAYAEVVIDSPALAQVRPDPAPFAEHFAAARDGIAVFRSLRGDALLIAPVPDGPLTHHAHLAAFVRGAPRSQVHALWAAVGEAIAARWAAVPAPVWVSTAGLGVHWLHVRLDARPKYYRHGPFRQFTP
ncbi:MAG: hypothetical protein KC636_22210 [Myxococcales bacterium]|nr:hypothetical protein [Myxococcales bacterium]